jgi:hypothetical protein
MNQAFSSDRSGDEHGDSSPERTPIQFVGRAFGAIDQLRQRLEEVEHLAPRIERDFTKGLRETLTLSRGAAVFLVDSAEDARTLLKSVEMLAKFFVGGQFGMIIVARAHEMILRQATMSFKGAKVISAAVGVNELHDLVDQQLLRIGVASCKTQGRSGHRASGRASNRPSENKTVRRSTKRNPPAVLIFKGQPLAGFNFAEEVQFRRFYGEQYPVEYLERTVLYLRKEDELQHLSKLAGSHFRKLVSPSEIAILLDEARTSGAAIWIYSADWKISVRGYVTAASQGRVQIALPSETSDEIRNSVIHSRHGLFFTFNVRRLRFFAQVLSASSMASPDQIELRLDHRVSVYQMRRDFRLPLYPKDIVKATFMDASGREYETILHDISRRGCGLLVTPNFVPDLQVYRTVNRLRTHFAGEVLDIVSPDLRYVQEQAAPQNNGLHSVGLAFGSLTEAVAHKLDLQVYLRSIPYFESLGLDRLKPE